MPNNYAWEGILRCKFQKKMCKVKLELAIYTNLSKYIKSYFGKCLGVPSRYAINGARGEVSPTLFWKKNNSVLILQKMPWFWKNFPCLFAYMGQILIQNIIYRNVPILTNFFCPQKFLVVRLPSLIEMLGLTLILPLQMTRFSCMTFKEVLIQSLRY